MKPGIFDLPREIKQWGNWINRHSAFVYWQGVSDVLDRLAPLLGTEDIDAAIADIKEHVVHKTVWRFIFTDKTSDIYRELVKLEDQEYRRSKRIREELELLLRDAPEESAAACKIREMLGIKKEDTTAVNSEPIPVEEIQREIGNE